MSLQQSEADVQMRENLRSHVYTLAADSMDGRGIGTRGLEKSARYIRECIERMSDETGLHKAEFDSFSGPDGTILVNIGTVLQGAKTELPPIVVAAHYDHLGVSDQDSCNAGSVLNGAHDNASGVAAVLEASRLLARRPHSLTRTVEFQFFSGEEAGLLGSRHYVQSAITIQDSIYAVINVDAVGHLEDNPLISIGLAGQNALAGVVSAVADSLTIDLVESPHSYETGDHAPFLSEGIPGFQITTGPHLLMNTPGDDANTLDYIGLCKITTLLQAVIESLATTGISLETPKPPRTAPRDSTRTRVRFGIVPSFQYSGAGVCALNIVGGSPAEHAGIRNGDVINAIDDHGIETLGDLAMALRTYSPGDSAIVSYTRSGVSQRSLVIFTARNE